MMTTAARRLFVDTNILIYATNSQSLWHQQALDLLQTANQAGIELVVSTQVLREYLAVATRAAAIGSGLSLQQIIANVSSFQTNCAVLEETVAVSHALQSLLQQVPCAGKQVHDANIVATMQVNAIPSLLTHNVDDFKRFANVIDLVPLEDAKTWIAGP